MENRTKETKITLLELAFLKQLLNEDTSAVELIRDKLQISLHPFYTSNFSNSIKEVLNSKVSKYNKSLGGILLGYENIKLLTNVGRIINDDYVVHVHVEADFYVFRPAIGSELKAVVTKTSHAHVGCLVHKLFNVNLPKPDDDDEWLGYSAHVGNELVFKVEHMNLEARVPYFRGNLISILSELDSGLSTSEESKPSTSKRKTKGSRVGFNAQDKDEGYDTNDSLQKKKKKKKHNTEEVDWNRIGEETVIDTQENEYEWFVNDFDTVLDGKVQNYDDCETEKQESVEKKPKKSKKRKLSETLTDSLDQTDFSKPHCSRKKEKKLKLDPFSSTINHSQVENDHNFEWDDITPIKKSKKNKTEQISEEIEDTFVTKKLSKSRKKNKLDEVDSLPEFEQIPRSRKKKIKQDVRNTGNKEITDATPKTGKFLLEDEASVRQKSKTKHKKIKVEPEFDDEVRNTGDEEIEDSTLKTGKVLLEDEASAKKKSKTKHKKIKVEPEIDDEVRNTGDEEIEDATLKAGKFLLKDEAFAKMKSKTKRQQIKVEPEFDDAVQTLVKKQMDKLEKGSNKKKGKLNVDDFNQLNMENLRRSLLEKVMQENVHNTVSSRKKPEKSKKRNSLQEKEQSDTKVKKSKGLKSF